MARGGTDMHCVRYGRALDMSRLSLEGKDCLRGSAHTILIFSLAADPPYSLRRLLEWHVS